MERNTPTDWFYREEANPVHEGVYQVTCPEWEGWFVYFALWKNGEWHLASRSEGLAERESRRSILMYEHGAKWRGVVEKPEWAA